MLSISSGYQRLLYFVLCQVGWFVCVLGAAHDIPWVSIPYVALALGYHFRSASRPRAEWRLLLATLAIAAVWESILVSARVLVYPNGMVIAGMVPYWILALWCLLAMQFNLLFGWLKRRWWLSAIVGGIGGPLSFRAGVALGAARFPNTPLALTVLAIGWAILLPLLLALADRWDRQAASAVR